MNALRSFSIVALLAASAPRALAAGAPPRLLIPFEDEVRAGQKVELGWADLPAGTRELEILLSVDGGRHYRLRVSPELEPEHGGFVWRVPNLPTSEARLLLRYHRGGPELSGEPSAPFRIVGREGEAIESRPFHEGSWWSSPRDDVEEEREAAPPNMQNPGAASLDPLTSYSFSALTPRAPAGLPALERMASDPGDTPASPAPGPAARPAIPRFVPLRN